MATYGNYALVRDAGNFVATITESGLRSTGINTSGKSSAAISTIPFNVEDTEGFYVESQWLVGAAEGANYNSIGLVPAGGVVSAAGGEIKTADAICYQEDGGVKDTSSTHQSYTAWGANTGHRPVMFVKAGKVWFGLDKNAGSVTWNGDPDAGSGEALSGLTGMYNFVSYQYQNSSMRFNFGAIAFLYTPPTGGKSIHTGNLPAPAIINPDDHYFSTVVTHDGSSTVSTCSFNLDTYEWLAIIKNVDNAEIWYWIDSLKGVTKYQDSSTGNAGVTDANVLTVSGTTFTLGSTLLVDDYLVEFHKAGLASATASNTDGTINTTETSANTVSGFSILLYTGTGANATVGHGLEVAPDMVIVWNSSQDGDIPVGHVGLGGFTKNLRLQGNNALATTATYFNNTDPTATVTAIGTSSDVNGSSGVIVHYSWHSVEGYSSFGSYEGNGAADGTFIGTNLYGAGNFVKNIDSANYSWQFVSTVQQGYNTGANPSLQFNTTGTGGTAAYDVVSTGLKMRTANINYNTAETFIYASWGGRPIQGDGGINQGRADGSVQPYAQGYGGNQILRVGNFWVHIFTSSGTFTPIAAISVEYLVVAGGGGGAEQHGGGGGAGGFRTATGLATAFQTHAVTVGAGGAGSAGGSNARGANGSNSVFNGITSIGGGGGGTYISAGGGNSTGAAGGSGGGGSNTSSGSAAAAGAGTAGQGNAGGVGFVGDEINGASGGGGAGAVGGVATSSAGGAGGVGIASSITGVSVFRSGGGGGGINGNVTAAAGGNGGGGAGGQNTADNAVAGTANTGGGGGGGSSGSKAGAAGGSGIVIIKYAIG